MKSITVFIFCFCSLYFSCAHASMYFTFKPSRDAEVISYNIYCKIIPESIGEVQIISVPQAVNLDERICVEIPNIQNNTTYEFTVSSANSQGVEGRLSEPLLFSTKFETQPILSKVDGFQIEFIMK